MLNKCQKMPLSSSSPSRCPSHSREGDQRLSKSRGDLLWPVAEDACDEAFPNIAHDSLVKNAMPVFVERTRTLSALEDVVPIHVLQEGFCSCKLCCTPTKHARHQRL